MLSLFPIYGKYELLLVLDFGCRGSATAEAQLAPGLPRRRREWRDGSDYELRGEACGMQLHLELPGLALAQSRLLGRIACVSPSVALQLFARFAVWGLVLPRAGSRFWPNQSRLRDEQSFPA